MTNCYEVNIDTSAAQADFIGDLLMGMGSLGVSLSPHTGDERLMRVSAYFPIAEDPETLSTHLSHQLTTAGADHQQFKLTIKVIGESDWQNQWKAYYHTQNVTRWLTIVPEWEHVENADRLTVHLDPEVTFGTGYHPTTRLALSLLGDELSSGDTLIDVGTGSGILAITADLLGASHVYAFDNDPACEQAVAHNLALNPKATHVTFQVKDMLNNVSETADIIVANILSEVLLQLIPQVDVHLNPGGKLILSGIYYDQYEVIAQELKDYGFEIIESRKRGAWYALLATRHEG
ncbi:MAG: 50S ribosomal protein L11 methyltransferase [Aerococcus sp.]|nr:50S ribosomal protein L11 methyltransferase [Aerococcus sp.]